MYLCDFCTVCIVIFVRKRKKNFPSFLIAGKYLPSTIVCYYLFTVTIFFIKLFHFSVKWPFLPNEISVAIQ